MRAFFIVALAAILSACFGRSALEAYQLGSSSAAGGSGGSGGSGTAVTSGSTTQQGPGQTTTTVVTTSTGPSPCDFMGACALCAECTFQDLCAEQLNACLTHPACLIVDGCVQSCNPNDEICIDACIAQNPEAAALYFDFLQCVLCDFCPSDCAEQAPLCDFSG